MDVPGEYIKSKWWAMQPSEDLCGLYLAVKRFRVAHACIMLSYNDILIKSTQLIPRKFALMLNLSIYLSLERTLKEQVW